MEWLIWIGAAVSAVGLAGLVWCIVSIARARRLGLSDDQMRDRLRKAVTINMAAFLTSVLGLILVVVGVILA